MIICKEMQKKLRNYFVLFNFLFAGEKRPSRVRADVTINLNVRDEIKNEWENLRKHDVCFLVTVKPVNPIGN